MQNHITTAITKGLRYLAACQEPDGSFVSYLSNNARFFHTETPIKTTFIPSLILASLAHIDQTDSIAVRQKIAAFLLSEKSEQWTFNYWARDELLAKSRPYPDDLDDTFCALIALYEHDAKLITSKALVAMTKILLATETEIGGPYRTWVVSPESDRAWLDIDIAVNSNIAYFLSRIAKPPENLSYFLEQAISNNTLTSPYYPSAYPLIYYLSRGYNGPSAESLTATLLEDPQVLGPLDHALIAISMLRLGSPINQATPHIRTILSSQQKDGSWEGNAFCIDQQTSHDTYYNGCPALTTAFAIEALHMYQKALTTQAKQNHVEPKNIKEPVFTIVTRECSKLEQPLHSTLTHLLRKLADSSNGLEIMDFAASCNQSLKNPLKGAEPFLYKLGAANLYGWAAYTIYDDFLDDEGKPLLLPAANTALRLSYEHFLDAVPQKSFQAQVRKLFELIDNANTWELTYCRFNVYKKRLITTATLPDYKDLSPLADRSVGHALGPLSVLAKSGVRPDSTDFNAIYTALRHYLIAKQLNDDAHDWQEDFLHGHISYVVTAILSELAIPQGTYKFHNLLPTMQKHFWHHTLNTICEESKRQLQLGRQALSATDVFKQENIISHLLDSIEASLEDTLTKQAHTKEFLKHF